jgi:hypothetical protein
MTTNVKNYAVGATEKLHYGQRHSGGYPAGLTGTIAAGSDQGMLTYKGFAAFNETPATAENIPIQADAGNLGTMFSRAIENSEGTLTFNAIDGDFQALAEDLTVFSDGDREKVGIDDSCTVLNPLSLIINNHATSLEAASLNEKGWEVVEIYKTTAEKTDDATSGTEFTAQPQGYNLTFENVSVDLNAATISNTNYGRTSLRGQRYWAENPVIRHVFIGDGVTTTLVLDETPAAEDGDKVVMYTDGVKDTYTTDYSVVAATKTITFVVAPVSNAVVVIDYEYVISC